MDDERRLISWVVRCAVLVAGVTHQGSNKLNTSVFLVCLSNGYRRSHNGICLCPIFVDASNVQRHYIEKEEKYCNILQREYLNGDMRDVMLRNLQHSKIPIRRGPATTIAPSAVPLLSPHVRQERCAFLPSHCSITDADMSLETQSLIPLSPISLHEQISWRSPDRAEEITIRQMHHDRLQNLSPVNAAQKFLEELQYRSSRLHELQSAIRADTEKLACLKSLILHFDRQIMQMSEQLASATEHEKRLQQNCTSTTAATTAQTFFGSFTLPADLAISVAVENYRILVSRLHEDEAALHTARSCKIADADKVEKSLQLKKEAEQSFLGSGPGSKFNGVWNQIQGEVFSLLCQQHGYSRRMGLQSDTQESSA